MHSSGTIAGSMFSGTIAGPMVSGIIAGPMVSGTIAGSMRLQLGDDLIVRLHDHRILRWLRLHDHAVGVNSWVEGCRRGGATSASASGRQYRPASYSQTESKCVITN